MVRYTHIVIYFSFLSQLWEK